MRMPWICPWGTVGVSSRIKAIVRAAKFVRKCTTETEALVELQKIRTLTEEIEQHVRNFRLKYHGQ